MKLLRRQFLHLTAGLAAGAATLPIASRLAMAQAAYPARPVRMVVAFAAGQSIDILARLIGQSLSDKLGQQFIIENRPGAGGNIGTEAVVRSPADGYTLLVIGANNAINATLYDNLSFNLLRDIVPVAGIYNVRQVMVVNPSFPARTVSEFIAYAKANPGKVNFASAGSGSVAHATGELFKMMTGVDMLHVPYRGAPPALTDLIGGQVHVMFDNIPSSIQHIKGGRLRALGVSSPTRLDALPDVPSLSDTVKGFETAAFAGLGAPKGTPQDIVEKLNAAVNAALADPGVKGKIADLGGTPLSLSAAEFAKFLVDETEKWGKVVKFSGAKPE
jgi:tripartite-type tricarboxylate transporter receptor subunit TctC